MKGALLLASSCLLIAGCGMDEAQRKYPTYAAYAAGGAIADDYMAAPVLPKSATAIDFDIDLDQDELSMDFNFVASDLPTVVAGFQTMPNADLLRLAKEPWFKLADPQAVVMRRCSDQRVEFLALGATHVHLQSTVFPAMLTKFCAP